MAQSGDISTGFTPEQAAWTQADWDQAYDNYGAIADSHRYPAAFEMGSKAFRAKMSALNRCALDCSYGPDSRHRFDVFRPEGASRGTVVYVHGGYWKATDKSFWSEVARGPVAHGYTVCLPSYRLAPDVRISDITADIARALTVIAEREETGLRLVGHSAGGHLVTRMMCRDASLGEDVQSRIERVASMSGVHDLRPLLRTSMNEVLRLTEAEAEVESPMLHTPIEVPLMCWVGADELPEFVRQNRLLATAWAAHGLEVSVYEAPGRNHFTVRKDLIEPGSTLTRWLVS